MMDNTQVVGMDFEMSAAVNLTPTDKKHHIAGNRVNLLVLLTCSNKPSTFDSVDKPLDNSHFIPVG